MKPTEELLSSKLYRRWNSFQNRGLALGYSASKWSSSNSNFSFTLLIWGVLQEYNFHFPLHFLLTYRIRFLWLLLHPMLTARKHLQFEADKPLQGESIQCSPISLKPETSFVEDNLSADWGKLGSWLGMTHFISIIITSTSP